MHGFMLMYFVMILWYIIHCFPLLVYLGHPHKLLVLVLCLFFLFFFLECCWKLYLSCNFAGLGHLAFHFSPFIVWTTQMISYGALYRWTCVYNLFPHISDSLLLAVFFYYADRKNTWCWAHQRRVTRKCYGLQVKN